MQNLYLYVIVGLVLLVLVLVAWIVRLEKRITRVFAGKKAESLEELMNSLAKDIAALKRYSKESSSYLEDVERRLSRSVQSVETVRFNPWKGVGEGGNQSFSTAFVNEAGDGVIITALHTRDRISMFAKPVKKFSSEHELSEEEHEVVAKAKTSVAGARQ